jgi:HSP20 family molecular chaperone IbpA
MSLKLKRSCYAYIRFCSPLPFNRRLRPDVLHARPARRRGRFGAQLSALQYCAERRERLRISVAVAGFTDADLSIEAKENTLTIRGEKQGNDEEKTGEVLYKGIAERTFERSFQLADHVVVKGARLENGLLHVDLVREIPEAMKPRAIPIASSGKVLEVQPTKAAA